MKHFFFKQVLFFFFSFKWHSGGTFLHYLKTFSPPIVLWILQRITQRFGEIVPSCLSKFAFAWIINLSQEWKKRQDFFLCFQSFRVTGVIGIILFHNMHTVFCGIWMFASCSHSLHYWFQGLPALLQTETSLRSWLLIIIIIIMRIKTLLQHF